MRPTAIMRLAFYLLALPLVSLAQSSGSSQHQPEAIAITEVFGDGQKFTAVALAFDQPIKNASLSPNTYCVENRTVTRVYASPEPKLAAQGRDGAFVIIELSTDDPGAVVYAMKGREKILRTPSASILQVSSIATTPGGTITPSAAVLKTSRISNLVVDEFEQREFRDPKTGDLLRYNLFTPRNYDPRKRYPLVLFMHDAGASSTDTRTTLVQGLGAIVWASPLEQAKHEAFVLAPQYSTQIVNDRSDASSFLETTVDLVHTIAAQYSIDPSRLYTTGQSGGAMLSLAIDIKYPDLFAASYIVAGQWDTSLVAPLVHAKLWIVVSEGDLKAYPGQNQITSVLEKAGAKVSRAVWDGRSTPEQFSAAVRLMETEGSTINYVALRKGTVVPSGQADDGGSNHVNTWRIAYTIEGIRDWLFRQHR